MNMYDTQLAVETHFQDNWEGDIHYTNTEKLVNSEAWIFLDVEPLYTESGISGCIRTDSLIYITAYASNKVTSAQLADKVVRFLSGVKLAGTAVGTWRPIAQGEVYSGLHFRKIAFALSNFN